MILTIFILNFFNELGRSKDALAQEFALGSENTAYFAKNSNNHFFHCSDFDYQPISNCIKHYDLYYNSMPVILWLGNSQLHGINQASKGLTSAPEILHEKLLKDYFLLTISIPNINIQEQYLIYEYLKNFFNIKHVLLALSFDNMREDGIRPSLHDVAFDLSFIDDFNRSSFESDLLSSITRNEPLQSDDFKGISNTIQETSEEYLNSFLEEYWGTWDYRGNLRSWSLISLYQIRNVIFGIDSSSIRKKIPARYDKNLNAFEKFLSSINNSELIKFTVYSAPIRNDINIPYDLKEFTEFKRDIQELVSRYGYKGKFYDLQYLIPDDYWGTVFGTNSTTSDEEIDFMHFQGMGHQILAEEIKNILKNDI